MQCYSSASHADRPLGCGRSAQRPLVWLGNCVSRGIYCKCMGLLQYGFLGRNRLGLRLSLVQASVGQLLSQRVRYSCMLSQHMPHHVWWFCHSCRRQGFSQCEHSLARRSLHSADSHPLYTCVGPSEISTVIHYEFKLTRANDFAYFYWVLLTTRSFLSFLDM